MADADADVRAADDVVRRVLQSSGRRREPLVLGRVGGDRPDRGRHLRGAAVRGGAVLCRHRPRRRAAGADRPAAPARRTAGAGRAPGAAGGRPAGGGLRRTPRGGGGPGPALVGGRVAAADRGGGGAWGRLDRGWGGGASLSGGAGWRGTARAGSGRRPPVSAA